MCDKVDQNPWQDNSHVHSINTLSFSLCQASSVYRTCVHCACDWFCGSSGCGSGRGAGLSVDGMSILSWSICCCTCSYQISNYHTTAEYVVSRQNTSMQILASLQKMTVKYTGCPFVINSLLIISFRHLYHSWMCHSNTFGHVCVSVTLCLSVLFVT